MFTPSKRWKGGEYSLEQLESLYTYVRPSKIINNLQNFKKTISGISSISANDVSNLNAANNSINVLNTTIENEFAKQYSFQTSIANNLKSYITTSGFDIFNVENQNNYDTSLLSTTVSSLNFLSTEIKTTAASLPMLEYIESSTLVSYKAKNEVNSILLSTYNGLSSLYSSIQMNILVL